MLDLDDVDHEHKGRPDQGTLMRSSSSTKFLNCKKNLTFPAMRDVSFYEFFAKLIYLISRVFFWPGLF